MHHVKFPLTVASCFPHLYFGSDICLAALRPPSDPWLVLWQSSRALWLAQHGAGRQLGVCLRVRERLLGEAKWCHLRRTSFSFHRQDRRWKDGHWRERGEALLEARTGHSRCAIQIQIWTWWKNMLDHFCTLQFFTFIVQCTHFRHLES